MREMAEDGFTELKNCQNGMLAVEIGFQIDSKEVEEGRSNVRSDGKLCFIEIQIEFD